MCAATHQRDTYRSAGELFERLHAMVWLRRAELQRLPSVVVATYRRRLARLVGGAVGVGVGLSAFVALIAAHLDVYGHLDALPPRLLVLAWPAMALGWLLGWCAGGMALRSRLRRWLRLSGSPINELARLSEQSSSDAAAETAHRLEAASVAAPLMALSLAAPLTMHLLVSSLALGQELSSFTGWMKLSAVIVGHAHLFLAGAALWFARRLCTRSVDELKNTGWKIFGLTVAVSSVPGLVLWLLPPILTSVTGLVFVPAMFAWARRVVGRERDALLLDRSSSTMFDL